MKSDQKSIRLNSVYSASAQMIELVLIGLRGLGSQKIDFFIIEFLNSITIQKVNAKVLNCLDKK